MANCLDTPMYINLRTDFVPAVEGNDRSAPLKVAHTSTAHLAFENAHLSLGNLLLTQELTQLNSLRWAQERDSLPPFCDYHGAGPALLGRQSLQQDQRSFISGDVEPSLVRASRVSEQQLQPKRYAKRSSLSSDSSATTDRSSISSDSTAVISSADSNDTSYCTTQSDLSAEAKVPQEGAQLGTTIVLRNIPNRTSRAALILLFEKEGFRGDYDMVYMPIDFATRAAFGYAFVNCVSHLAAERFLVRFQGFSGWSGGSDKVCQATWSKEQGGLHLHIERYRNSPVMHESVPDEFRPALFRDGDRVPFPEPTKRLRKARIIGYKK